LIVEALERGDLEQAEQLMQDHLQHVESGLTQVRSSDPLEPLRQALASVSRPGAASETGPPRQQSKGP
jgi:hypothetical protein